MEIPIPLNRAAVVWCPKCGGSMILREPRAGQEWDPFWGCEEYPDCRQTVPIDRMGEPIVEGTELDWLRPERVGVDLAAEGTERTELVLVRRETRTMVEQADDLMALTIKRPDKAAFDSAEIMLAVAREAKITSVALAQAAGADLRAVKSLEKELEEKRTTITGPINQALKRVNALFKPAQDWLAQAEQILKAKLLDFQREQERVARQAQHKLDLEAEAERMRLADQARLAEAAGKAERAAEILVEADAVVAPQVVAAPEVRIEGLSTRETWRAEVVDKAALLRHLLDVRPDLLGVLVEIKQPRLNDLVRVMKDQLNLPGVEVKREAVMAARAS